MLFIWAKRIGAALVLGGVTLGLAALMPLLSPLQGEGTVHDYRLLILAGVLLGAGLVAMFVAVLGAALFPEDDQR